VSLISPDLVRKPRDHVPNQAASLELLDHEYPIRRVFPNSQFVTVWPSTSSRE